jgi:hypothetical protein
LIKVVFPTPGGPTTPTTSGGASSGSLSTKGTCNLFSLTSPLRAAFFKSFPGALNAKAFGLGCPDDLAFSFFAGRCAVWLWSSPAMLMWWREAK